MHHTLLLQVLIALRLAQLDDVVLPLAPGILDVCALLEVLLAGHSSTRLHGDWL
jgi:hypothetical protein